MRKPKFQGGFSAIELILILVILGLVGGLGWYVYDSNQKSQTALNNADQSNNQTPTKQADPTSDWVAYSNKDGHYSLKYPSSWYRPSSEELCYSTLLMLGPTKETTGKCASDGFGQMFVISVSIENSDDYKLTPSEGYRDIKSEEVTVDGIKGIKQSAVADDQIRVNELNPLPDGTKVVVYVFATDKRIYAATYTQTPDNKDVLSDFNLMITKTLKFSS